MPHEVVFASERIERLFEKALKTIPSDYHQTEIIESIRGLSENPWPGSKRSKKLRGKVAISQFIAEYRLRIGPYRVLYDVDGTRKKVVLLKLVKRDEQTYH